ncbi:MAG: lipid-A-disaccharide synthase [bacterium]
MKKVFILAGELSGDKTAGWYLGKITLRSLDEARDRRDERGERDKNVVYEAIGGDHLVAAGAKIYQRFEVLNIVGLIEIIKHLRFIFRFLNQITNYIIQNNFDEVILVDFPGFNLRLAKKLKKKNPDIKITYLSPPQLWIWGVGRIKKLKKYCDDLIVLYPFEVSWYEKRGINARYLGNPVYDELKDYFELAEKKENKIVILPGSRKSEIKKLLPIFISAVNRFSLANSRIELYLPLAESIDTHNIQKQLRKLKMVQINIIKGEKEKLKILSSSCLAFSKPGTTTLQLALLKVPTIVVYKTSWLTYFMARLLVHVKFMSLPNLFLNHEMFKELIQFGCNSNNISTHLNSLYDSCMKKDERYEKLQNDFCKIREIFSSHHLS